MATISIRVDDKLKEQLLHVSDELWLSVSSLFHAWAKSLVRTWKVSFSLGDDFDVDYVSVNEPMEDVLAQMRTIQWKNG